MQHKSGFFAKSGTTPAKHESTKKHPVKTLPKYFSGIVELYVFHGDT
jgi:hypothetical protein